MSVWGMGVGGVCPSALEEFSAQRYIAYELQPQKSKIRKIISEKKLRFESSKKEMR
jgi:hypothetical protein